MPRSLPVVQALPPDPDLVLELEELERERPRARVDCAEGLRPCPFVSCRYHLLWERKKAIWQRQFRRGERTLREDEVVLMALSSMQATCALDVADAGGVPLGAVAEILGVKPERVRQIEVRALLKVDRPELFAAGFDPNEPLPSEQRLPAWELMEQGALMARRRRRAPHRPPTGEEAAAPVELDDEEGEGGSP